MMEETRTLELSDDPVSILKDISKLVEEIKKYSKPKIEEVSQMKQLQSQICDKNAVRSVTACQGLLSLVEDDILTPMHAVSMLVSFFSIILNFAGVTATLGVLLRWDIKRRPSPYHCPFLMTTPQHPLITLLREKKDTWPDVFRLVQNFFFHQDTSIKEKSMCLLKPVLMYVLCDPQTSPHLPRECRLETWAFLLHHSSAKQLILEMLPWFQISDDSRCVEAGTLLQQLCESALATSDVQLCLALAPLAASSTLSLVSRGADPEPSLATIVRMLQMAPNAASCVLSLLADAITECPATFLRAVIDACKDIITMHTCSKVAAFTVVVALLPWLATPSVLTRDALQLATELLTTIRGTVSELWKSNTVRLCANPWFRSLRHTYPHVHEAAELCRIQESWRNAAEVNRWLKQVLSSSSSLPAQYSTFFCSLLLCDTNEGATEEESIGFRLSVLVERCVEQPKVGRRVALTILYQLAQEHRADQQLALLRSLARMGKQEDNMVFVLGVLKSLAVGGDTSSTLAIDLYFRLWKVRPRAYRLLYEVLTAPCKTDDPDKIWEVNLAKAAVIREICLINPDAHGSDLVPVLSQLLTHCTGPDGSLASALAVQGITALCRAGIMDVASTWRGLAPKLAHDKRPNVVVSLCELLRVVSLLPTTTSKYEDFILEVTVTLWEWGQNKNSQIACAALKALADFHLNQISLKGLPNIFRQNLKLPPSFCQTPIDAKRDPSEVLPYIPGDCWKQVLEGLGSQEDRKAAVCDLLASWMCHEIKLFHRGLYYQTPGKPEPTSYNHLPDGSILKTIFDLAYHRKHSPSLAQLGLSILAKDFPRPLPPVSWNFLEDKLSSSADHSVRRDCLVIAARQCKSSKSASHIITSQMTALNPQENMEDCKTLFSVLLYLGQGISPSHMGPFLQRCLSFAVEESKEDVNNLNLLQLFLFNIKTALRSPDTLEANMIAFSDIIEKLADQFNISDPGFEHYIDCAINLPGANIERIVSPSLWWEISQDKLLRSIRISSAVALAEDSAMPLCAVNECVDTCLKMGYMEQEFMLKTLITIIQHCRNHQSNCRWLLQLAGRIETLKADKDIAPEQKREVLQYACDVLMVSVITLAGHDVLAGEPAVLASSSQDQMLLFPRALQALLGSSPSWNNLAPQFIEWLLNLKQAIGISDPLSKTFHWALTSLRGDQYFKKPSVWMRILSS